MSSPKSEIRRDSEAYAHGLLDGYLLAVEQMRRRGVKMAERAPNASKVFLKAADKIEQDLQSALGNLKEKS